MAQTFTCKNCHKIKTKNPRLKGQQHYCGDKPCQRARKTAWQKQKMANDSAYREKQCQAMDNWRKHKPLHQYQKEYRATHPDYVRHNRTRQTIRNQKRASVEQIVNMDAFIGKHPAKSALLPDAIFPEKSRRKDCKYGHVHRQVQLFSRFTGVCSGY